MEPKIDSISLEDNMSINLDERKMSIDKDRFELCDEETADKTARFSATFDELLSGEAVIPTWEAFFGLDERNRLIFIIKC